MFRRHSHRGGGSSLDKSHIWSVWLSVLGKQTPSASLVSSSHHSSEPHGSLSAGLRRGSRVARSTPNTPAPAPLAAALQLTQNDPPHQAGSPHGGLAPRGCLLGLGGPSSKNTPLLLAWGTGAKCGVCIQSAQHHLIDLCGWCYLSFSVHVLLLCCLGPGEVSMRGIA